MTHQSMTNRHGRIRHATTAGLLALFLLPGAASAQPEERWRTTGFDQPESVLFDAERDLIYVSNVNGSPTEKDGNGYIATLTRDGRISEAQWVTGLDAPKGMALHDGRLYVSDIDRLVAIDTIAGEIVESHPAAGAEFLNDVTVDGSGRVFVSDMMTDRIHVLEQGRFEPWTQDAALNSPNGLLAEGDRLVVAAWGVPAEGGEQKGAPGHLKVVDYETRTVRSLGDGTPIGNLDGIEAAGDGSYLVTDWIAGALFRIQPSGEAERLLDLNQGSADLDYIADDRLALIPMMMDGAVAAYRID